MTTEFEPGFNVVLGPNGAGKTTLFRVGASVLPPDSGTIKIGGSDPFQHPGVKRSIGYLPHGTPLNGRLTVRGNLDYWGRVHGFDAATRERQIERMTETMHLGDLLSRTGTNLSRGQKQRVTIARCLIPDPSVIFLDEPTTGLDPTAAESLRMQLASLADEGRTLCYSTHNLYEADQLADQLTIVRDGGVDAQAPIEELTASVQDAERTVRVSCDATADDFDALDARASPQGGDWVVELPVGYQIPDLIRDLVARDISIRGVYPDAATLEDVYRELTGGDVHE